MNSSTLFRIQAGREERHDTKTKFCGTSSISIHWRWYWTTFSQAASKPGSVATRWELTHSISQPAFLHCAMSFPASICAIETVLPQRHCERLPTSTIFRFRCTVNRLVAHLHCHPVIQMWAIHLTTSQQKLPEVRFWHQRTGLVQWLATIDPSFLLEVSWSLLAFASPQTLVPWCRFLRLADPPGLHLMRVQQSGQVA